MLTLRQIGDGSSQVDYGGNEKPKYTALRDAINRFYADLLRPLGVYRAHLFTMLGLPEIEKSETPFRYTAAHRRNVDRLTDEFLLELAGPIRDQGAFHSGGAGTSLPDGIIQQQDILAYAVGLQRAAAVMRQTQTLTAGRQTPAVAHMLNDAFARLSDKGALRLEGVRDQIHGILVSAQDAGLNPIATARQLAKQFDQYESWEFQRLARTEAAFAAEAGVRNQFREFGVTKVRWLIDVSACPICKGFENQIFDIDDTDHLPPEHPNCLCSTLPLGVEEPSNG